MIFNILLIVAIVEDLSFKEDVLDRVSFKEVMFQLISG